MSDWIHQVELHLDRQAAPERLRRIESWCTDWQLGFRVIETTKPDVVRVAFEDPRFARAFHSHFGGVIVPVDEIAKAMDADAAAEDAFDRLAREYDFEA